MKIIYIHDHCVPKLIKSIVSIGAFDGVHKGHQTVIRNAVKKSKEMEITNVVYTFDPPPRAYFQGAQVITSIDEKLNRFQDLGVEHVIVIRFDELYVKRTASHFIQELQRLCPAKIYVGEDFRFGKDREGGIELLKRYFDVSIVEEVCCEDGERISSTRIRNYVFQGELQRSHSLLGWPMKTI
ncbi:FAD synthetase [Bacillus sp. C1]